MTPTGNGPDSGKRNVSDQNGNYFFRISSSKLILVLLIKLLTTNNLARAQSYTIESFEGNKANVNLYYKPASGMLSICYLLDTLRIDDYMSVDYVKVLDKVFLQINYVKRGGSNEGFRNQILLYVSNGRLGQALHVSSYSNYDLRPAEYSLFKLRATLTGVDADSYKLTLQIHNENRSERRPKSNYSYDKTKFLSFDKKSKCFYSNYEHVAGSYTLHDLKNYSGEKRYLKNDVPVVIIEKDKYYYLNGDWFSQDKDHFYSMSL